MPHAMCLHSSSTHCGAACSVCHKGQGKEPFCWSFCLSPLPHFACLSALCQRTLILQTEFWLLCPWVNQRRCSGVLEDGRKEGWEYFFPASCSPHHPVSVWRCGLCDCNRSSFGRPLLYGSGSQGAQNIISSPDPFSLGVVKALHCCQPLGISPFPVCPLNLPPPLSLVSVAFSWELPNMILCLVEALMDTALRRKWCINIWPRWNGL